MSKKIILIVITLIVIAGLTYWVFQPKEEESLKEETEETEEFLQTLINEIGVVTGFEFEPRSTAMMASDVRLNTAEGEMVFEGIGYGFGDTLYSPLIEEQFNKIKNLLEEKGFTIDDYNLGLGTVLMDVRRYQKDNIICNLKKTDSELKGRTDLEIACTDLEKDFWKNRDCTTESGKSLDLIKGKQKAMANDECREIGFKETNMCNEDTGTWWFDLKVVAEKPGCNPACVVDIETNETEINWRCTGAY